jgi:hypothetical protein
MEKLINEKQMLFIRWLRHIRSYASYMLNTVVYVLIRRNLRSNNQSTGTHKNKMSENASQQDNGNLIESHWMQLNVE